MANTLTFTWKGDSYTIADIMADPDKFFTPTAQSLFMIAVLQHIADLHDAVTDLTAAVAAGTHDVSGVTIPTVITVPS